MVIQTCMDGMTKISLKIPPAYVKITKINGCCLCDLTIGRGRWLGESTFTIERHPAGFGGQRLGAGLSRPFPFLHPFAPEHRANDLTERLCHHPDFRGAPCHFRGGIFGGISGHSPQQRCAARQIPCSSDAFSQSVLSARVEFCHAHVGFRLLGGAFPGQP